MAIHIGTTWRIQLNHPCAAAMKPFYEITLATCYCFATNYLKTNYKCGPMPDVMATLPNIGGALCSTPQFG